MCFVLNLSKYIFVPILLEWLEGKHLIAFHGSLTLKFDNEVLQSVYDNHRKLFQEKVFESLGLSSFSHHMIRWAMARGFDLNDFELIIDPMNNSKDFLAITSEIGFNDRSLKTKFECMKVVTQLKIKRVNNAKESNVVSRLLQCLKNVERLQIFSCPVYEKISKHCLHLRRLDILIKKCKLMGKFKSVFRYCEKLEHCGLHSQGWRDPVDQNFIVLIFSIIVNAKNLRSLQLIDMDLRSTMKLLTLYGTRKKLSEFSCSCIGGYYHVQPFLWYQGSKLVHLHFYSLMILNISDLYCACPAVTEVRLVSSLCSSDLKLLFENCKTLRSYQQGFTESSTIEVFAECEMLEKLHFNPCWTKQELEGIQFKWENMIELGVYNCSGLSTLLTYCVNLRCLSMQRQNCISECVLVNLETLDITGIGYYLIPLAIPVCPSLRELYCDKINEQSIAQIKQKSLSKNFKLLHTGRIAPYNLYHNN